MSSLRIRNAFLAFAFLLLCPLIGSAAPPPTRTTTMPDLAVLKNAADTTIDLTTYFSGATSYSVGNTNAALLTATISSSTLTLSYANNAIGTTLVTVTASNSGGSISSTFRVYVDNAITQSGSIADVTVNEDSSPTTINLDSKFNNANGYKIINNTASSTAVAAISGSTLTITYPANANGSGAITVAATNTANTNLESFNVTVTPVPDAPGVLNISSTVANITDTNTISLFSSAVITNYDSASETLNVIIQIDNSDKGDLTGTGISDTGFIEYGAGTNFYWAMSNTTASVISSKLQNITFRPTANRLQVGSSENVSFTVIAMKYATPSYVTTNNNRIINVTSVNDAPTIDGANRPPTTVFTGQTDTPFVGITITDPDVKAGGGRQNLTLVITQTGDTNGSLTFAAGSGFVRNGNVITLSNLPDDQITAQIRALTFQAQAASLPNPVQSYFTIAVTDDLGATATATNSVVQTATPFVSPDITGTESDLSVFDNHAILVFPQVAMQGSGTTVQIRILQQSDLSVVGDTLGDFVNLGTNMFVKSGTGTNAVYTFAHTTMEDATAAIRQIAFQPRQNTLTFSTYLVFEISLYDDSNAQLGKDSRTALQVTPFNDLPTILGATATRPINDNETIQPFLTRTNQSPTLVKISDPDENSNQLVTVTIQLDDSAKGSFTNANSVGFLRSSGSYVLTNQTPAAASLALQQLIFQPTANRLAAGFSETVRLRIIVDDHQGQGTVINDATTILVTSVNDAPIVNLATNLISASVSSTIKPFTGVQVVDPDAGSQTLNVTIALDDTSKGSLANLGGFTNSPNYTFVGTDVGASTNITNITFIPSPGFGSASGPSGRSVTFTISARDSQNALTVTNLVLTLIGSNRTFVVTTTNDTGAGSLRQAVANANNNDQIVFDITNMPAVIRLSSEIAFSKSLSIAGPGANKLTISGDINGDGSPDTRVFHVLGGAYVTVSGVTISKGTDAFSGGGVSIDPNGTLNMSFCAVTYCTAGQYGGAIDNNQGTLLLSNSLICSNSTTSALGQGGGGISFYTDLPCYVQNTTFAYNSQNAARGFGGGTIYAENSQLGQYFPVYVTSCTFKGNVDQAGIASAIEANSYNVDVRIQNTIVSDGSGMNLNVDGGALITSLGGNLSDDGTVTTFSQGGDPVDVILFDQTNDLRSVNVRLQSLANNGGPTMSFALATNSPAIGFAVSTNLPTDQRGYFRDNSPDSGAIELAAYRYLVINEIMFNPSAGSGSQFIEFYNPRDSDPIAITNYSVYVDGILRHVFTNQVLYPGEGLVVAASSSVAVTAGVKRENASTGGLNLDATGSRITVLNPGGQQVLSVAYNGLFNSNSLPLIDESVNLSPEFNGFSYIPYSMLPGRSGGATSSAGNDVLGAPEARVNAPPTAVNDATTTDQNTAIAIPVLANDIELDRFDYITVSNVVSTSFLGAHVTIGPGATNIIYDPSVSTILRSLPVGAKTNDTVVYNIIDCCDPNTGTNWPGTGTKYLATVTITNIGLNDAPTPAADTGLSTLANAVLIINAQTNLLANDTDPDTDDNANTLLISAVHPTSNIVQTVQATTTLGATVTLEIRANRNQSRVIYDPSNSATLIALPLGAVTNDTFYYSVTDSHGAQGAAKVTIAVTGVNNAPIAVNDTLYANEDAVLTVASSVLVTNDIDYDTGHSLSVSFVSANSLLGASVSLSGGNLIYNPTNSAALNALSRKETTNDTFSYIVIDGLGGSSTGLVTVVVSGRNDLPVSRPDFYTTDEDTPISIAANVGVLVNDFDPDVNGSAPDDTIHVVPFTNVQTASGAIVTMSTNGAFTFDPRDRFKYLAPGQSAQETFNYILIDNSLTIANDDVFSVQANSASVTLPVLANDALLSDSGGALSISGVGVGSKGGILSVSADKQSILYTPQASFVGTESFRYTIVDGQGGSDTATVTVNVVVDALNGVLAANADHFAVAAGNSVELDLLANDNILPANGSTLTITNLGTPSAGGTVTLTAGGLNNRVLYTPNPSSGATYPYFETFTYTISGGGSALSTATATIAVLDRTNTLPVNNDTFIVGAGGGVRTLDVLANDRIMPGTTPNLTIVSVQATNLLGTLSISSDHKTLLYSPTTTNSDYSEPTASYTISDGAGGTRTANISISVKPSGLFVGPDEFSVMKNSSSITLQVIPNDVILPNTGAKPTITLTGLGTNAASQGGTVLVSADSSSLIYTPATNFVGTETFTYEITDGTLNRASGQVRVKVIDMASVNTSADLFRVAHDSTSNRFDVLKNDYVLPRVGSNLTLVSLVTNATHGSVTISTSGTNNTVLYDAPTGFIGQDTFGYICADSLGNRGTNTVTVIVGGLLTTPDYFSVISGSSNNVLSVLTNDLFLPDTAGYRRITGVGAADQGGTVTTNSDGSALIYKPAANFVGFEHFTYNIKDDTGGVYTENVTVEVIAIRSDRAVGTVTVTITGINHPPIVRDDSSATDEDSPLVLPHATLLANDSDPDSGLTIASVSPVSQLGATVQIIGTNIVYNPQNAPILQALARNEVVLDTFTYTAVDDQGAPGTATVTVTVTGVNDAPRPGVQSYSTGAKTVLTVAAPGVLSNAVDIDINGVAPDDTIRTIAFVTNRTTAGGIVTMGTDGSFTYDPNSKFTALALGQTAQDSFTYTLIDSSETVANGDLFTVAANSTSNILAVLANDVTMQGTGGNLIITSVSAPNSGGTVAINTGGKSLLYSPANSFAGTETFTYTVSDGQGSVDTATVQITVAATLVSPTLNNDRFTVLSDTVNDQIDVLLNDVALPGTVAVHPIVGVSAANIRGTATTNAAGTMILYTPIPGYSGTETFSYSVKSSGGAISTATVSVNVVRANSDRSNGVVNITVVGVNDPPQPHDDVLTTDEDTVLNINVQNQLLSNDTDPDSDDNATTLLINAVHPSSNIVQTLQTTSALGATVTLEIRFDRNQSRVFYDPTTSSTLNALSAGETTVDSFWYSVVDSHGATASAQVRVTVNGRNDRPTANPDVVHAVEDTPLLITAAQLLGNDTDPDTDDNGTTLSTLQVLNVTPVSAQGATVIVTNGNVLYDPTPSSIINALARKEILNDSFSYVITDNAGGLSTNTVTVIVRGINDSPVAVADAYTNNESSVLVVNTPGLLANDTDADINGIAPDDNLRTIPFTNFVTGFGAIVNVNRDGSFSYDPNGRFNSLQTGQTATDTFSYTVMDNSFTVANDDNFSVISGTTTNSLPVVANDVLLANTGGTLALVSVSAPDHGGTIATNGNVVLYTPANGFYGVETFTYTITDSQGAFDTATVRVRVTSPNGKLVAADDHYTVAAGTTVPLNLAANDDILPGNGSAFTIQSVTAPSNGGLAVIAGTNAGNVVLYTPVSTANAFPYVETFNYTVLGLGGETATGAVSVLVTSRTNTLPVNNDSWVVRPGVATAIPVLANDLMLSNSPAYTIVSVQTNGLFGTVSIDPINNGLIYTPSAATNNYSEVPFQYTVTNGIGASGTATVSIQVKPAGVIATADAFTMFENSGTIMLPVLLNDVILPWTGQLPTITLIGIGTNAPDYGGTVVISPDNMSLSYTPATNFTGVETFTYEITDGTLTRAQAHVRVQVIDPSTVPTTADVFRVGRNSSNNTLDVLKNDVVLPETNALTIVSINTNGISGSISIVGSNANNTLSYTPKASFIGHDSFSYVAMDHLGALGTNTVTVFVGKITAHDDAFTVVSGTATNRLDVLVNDRLFSTGAAAQKIAGVTAGNHGGVITTNTTDDALLYTPAPGFAGNETFSYSLIDNSGVTYTQNVSVDVLLAGSDRSNAVVSVTIVRTGASTYYAWQSNYFGTAILGSPALEASFWGDNADPDGDGLSNLQEYIAGSDPLDANSTGTLAVSVSPTPDGKQIGFTFKRRRNDDKVTYALEYSTDLKTWRSGQSLIQSESATPIDSDFENVTWTIKSDQEHVFLRLNAY